MELLSTYSGGRRYPYKDIHEKNSEFTRDLILLWFSEDGWWKIKVNGELEQGNSWKTLGIVLQKLIDLKEKNHKSETVRRLVIWVNRLSKFHVLLPLALNENLETNFIKNFKQELLLWIRNKHIEFRNFDVISGEKASRVKEDFGFEGEEVDAMENYIKAQPEQNWARLRWTAAHCFESLFYRRLNNELTDKEKREINYEICCRKDNFIYNDFIYNGGKAGIIWIDKKNQRKIVENVESFDISQAYGGQFVRADDFPLGTIYPTKKPKEEVMKEKWYAFAFEFDKEIEPPIPWIKVFQHKDKWYCLLTKPDFDCMKIMGAKFKEKPTIKFQFLCKKVGYLHYKVRKTINDIYNERQQLKKDGNKAEKFLKQMNEVIYGKGLQTRENSFRYFCPQISYHALAKTRVELVVMMSKLNNNTACDSDSIKTTDKKAFLLFNNRNSEIEKELAAAGFTDTRIGMWKPEGCYPKFIQFEKKVYAYEDENGQLVCKFAGCNKEQLLAWLEEGNDINSLMSSMKIPGGVVMKDIKYNLNGDFWITTKYLDYSLDSNEIKAFMNRQKIICA